VACSLNCYHTYITQRLVTQVCDVGLNDDDKPDEVDRKTTNITR